MATKRRKVWVVESLAGGLMLFASAKLAKKCAGGTTVTPMFERRPGDVVLSREEVAQLEDMAWTLAGDHRRQMLGLLRGRR